MIGADDNEGGAQNSGAADGSDTSSVCVDIVGDPPLPGNHSELHSLSTFCSSSNHHCHWTFNAETQAFPLHPALELHSTWSAAMHEAK